MKPWQRGASLAGTVFGVVFLLFGGLLLWQRTTVVDYIKAATFEPSAEVAELVDATSMTDRGTRYFYAHRPVLEPTQKFNEYCASVEKTAHVLGCYDGQRIYLFDVDNPELAGVEEVTAAHEMLHVAYDRLTSAERTDLHKLLKAEAERLSGDTKFNQRMSAYQSLSEHELMHELHSILGTEVASLPPALENHYSRYFEDRSAVVELYTQYSGVFEQLMQRAEALASQLDQLALTINSLGKTYTRNVENLRQSIEAFNQRAESGYFSSQQAFNAARQPLVAAQESSQREYQRIQQLVAQYNSLKRQYDETSSHLAELSNSIDSSLAPVPDV